MSHSICLCVRRVSELLDYTAEELTGKNLYTLCHGQDVQKLRKCHVDLINKGQVMSAYYRLMNKNGGFTWLQTCATVICNSKNSDEQSIICVNYVLSGIEYEHCILDCSQMPDNLKPDDPSHSERESSPEARGKSIPDPEWLRIFTDGSLLSDSLNAGAGVFFRNFCLSTSLLLDKVLRLMVKSLRFAQLCPSCSALWKNSQVLLSSVIIELLYDTSSRDGCCTPKSTSDGKESSRTLKDPLRAAGNFFEKLHDLKAHLCPEQAMQVELSQNGFEMEAKQLIRYPDSKHACLETPPRAKKRRLVGDAGRKSPADSLDERSSTPPPADDKIDRPWKRSPRASFDSPAGSTAMSVKELEDVMNKHLPSEGAKGPQRSTIQWIGAPQTTLPASSLLRQIYVNRESVIRSGTHLTRPPAAYYEPQGPTPPASGDPYPDQGQFMLSGNVIAAAGYSGGGGSYMDAYSAMTPPASVSPRDHPGISETAAFSEAAAAAAAAAIPHMHHPYLPEGAPLPLKPQVFVHPGGLDAYAHPPHSSEQQYASGFHLYHPSSKASHHPPNGASWYSQPNS
ncbi:protein trachealess [Caerostris darwini]|uniref:Protein trachealess n=1 Tax=Caerostris darwini TaxID=1538125 RepID=A0AAV4STI6_9ARAC|nr:protein trachealess [Caerostris darwini]